MICVQLDSITMDQKAVNQVMKEDDGWGGALDAYLAQDHGNREWPKTAGSAREVINKHGIIYGVATAGERGVRNERVWVQGFLAQIGRAHV